MSIYIVPPLHGRMDDYQKGDIFNALAVSPLILLKDLKQGDGSREIKANGMAHRYDRGGLRVLKLRSMEPGPKKGV